MYENIGYYYQDFQDAGGTMWDTGYMDYYKWKTSSHAPADHNLSTLPWSRKDILRDGRQISNSQGGLGHDGMNHHGQDMHRASASSTGSFGRGSSTGSLSNTSTPTNTPNTPLVVPQPVKPNRTGKTYQCKMCDQIFSTKSDMMIHCQQIHKQDPKPYKCPTCSKCFANSSYLSQHNRIHTGIKPYKCEICERKFTQLSHLQQHIRTHTGEKPYKCMHPGCGKAFSQLSNLQSHSRSHMTDKPYRCNSCYKCYADEQGLREHIPKHSDTKHLKTHICHICGKSYTQETYLTRHMAKHSNESHKVTPRPIKTEPMDPADRDYGRMEKSVIQDGPIGGGACNKGVSSAFMPLPQFGPSVSSGSNSGYPYGPGLSSNSLSSPLPHISSMTSPRYFPYDPIGFRKSDPDPQRNLNVPMTPRDSMIANSLLSLQHIKNYASQQMPSFTPTCTTGSRL